VSKVRIASTTLFIARFSDVASSGIGDFS
jgi:hypothetical protein